MHLSSQLCIQGPTASLKNIVVECSHRRMGKGSDFLFPRELVFKHVPAHQYQKLGFFIWKIKT